MTASALARKELKDSLISLVLPVFNEEKAIVSLIETITTALKDCPFRYEFVFVNDGSTDGSATLLDQVAQENALIKVIHFSRNFGHQAAVDAGLKYAAGDALVVMDSDFQDDPNSIAVFAEKWHEGYDVVYAIRVARKEAPAKRFLFQAFYRIINIFSETLMPNDAGNFGLIDRKVADAIINFGEHHRFYSGLRAWVGFKQIGVPVERGARYDDTPRVNLLGLFSLARTALFSFSAFPLSAFYLLAFIDVLVFVGMFIYVMSQKLTGLAIPGWTSNVMTATIFGFINLLGIAILGEYIWRIYVEVRGRPRYLVSREINLEDKNPKIR